MTRARQSGATLLITLIMLIVITLFGISAFNTSTVNLKVVGNMQARQEALQASMRTVEETVSHTDFINTPANAIPNPCNGQPNTLCTDLNGDGVPELTTTLTPVPSCTMGRVITVAQLNFTASPDDLACVQAQQQGTFAVVGANPSGDSLCGYTAWTVRAQTLTTGATVATSDVNSIVTEGVGVRIAALNLPTSCP